MGRDTLIFCRCPEGDPLLEEWRKCLPSGISITPLGKSNRGPDGATHQIGTWERFYDEDYPRGWWPVIALLLQFLFHNPRVKVVWYGDNEEGVNEISRNEVLRLSEHFMNRKGIWYDFDC